MSNVKKYYIKYLIPILVFILIFIQIINAQTPDTINPNSGYSCRGIPKVKYAGKTYNTVQIGSQCWLKENLDVGVMIDSLLNQTNNEIIEKYCYNNDSMNCFKYGGLYQWNEAMQYSRKQSSRGICPPGWHIPSYSEFQVCSTTVDGISKVLIAIGQGNDSVTGTNTSGFSALLGGYRNNIGLFNYMSKSTLLWTSTEHPWGAHFMGLPFKNTNNSINAYFKEGGFSVRCLKD